MYAEVGSKDCRVDVFYREPQVGMPYHVAVCTCGWLGLAQKSARRATAEAHGHANAVTIHLSESAGSPAISAW
jgi:hypothetical protein